MKGSSGRAMPRAELGRHLEQQPVAAGDQLGIEDDTLFIFASDNCPEFRRPWRGTAVRWTCTDHTAMEGSLRVLLIGRWPGRVESGWVSDDMVRVTDLYSTLIAAACGALPEDRPIDGVNQLGWWTGAAEKSGREGLVFYIKTELRAAKWRHWKLHFILESEPNQGPIHLETPALFKLKRDAKEETDAAMDDGWVRGPMRRMVMAFEQSLREHPVTPPSAPDDFDPTGARR